MSKEAKYLIYLLSVTNSRFMVILDLYHERRDLFADYEKNAIEAMLALAED